MLFPEDGIGRRTFPAGLSRLVTERYRAEGVEVHPGALVARVERDSGVVRVRLEDGRAFEADSVVAGLGIEPSVELARTAGLSVDGGVIVDDQGRAGGRDDVFAAGDVTVFPVAALGRSTRVEHEDHALSHGRLAGRNAAGAGERYDNLPFFYSDLFDLGYEAVGEVDARHATVEAWRDPGRKGVVAFVDGERRPRGVLLWGIFGKVDDARELIRSAAPVAEDGLRALAG
jgi:NADPH-dependent 2,4-dienoyl-CoA reductase/sulfur reductase-like enzyme